MRPEKARKLQRLIWMQRLRLWGLPAAGVALVFALFVWATAENAAFVDPTVKTRLLKGEVASAARLSGRGGSYRVEVRLEDGREVKARSTLSRPPYKGEAVEVRAATHASGQITYTIAKLLE